MDDEEGATLQQLPRPLDHVPDNKKNESFPPQLESLDSSYQAIEYLDKSYLFDGYTLLGEGKLRIKLFEAYGYNRWIELTPQLLDHSRWIVIHFECQSNAEDHLLHTNGNYWCEHSP